MTDESADRTYWRNRIRPFAHQPLYKTGWNGSMSYEDICESLTPNINRLLRYYGVPDADIPDMIAHSFMNLWEELTKTQDFLATQDRSAALTWLLNHGNNAHYLKFYKREVYLQDLATSSGEPDDFIIEGFEHGRGNHHAGFAEAVEQRFDIENAMNQMAEKYMHSLPHLAALYYITTSVSVDDAAALAGRGGSKKSWWLTKVVKPVREELCELLELSAPARTTWQDRHRAGEEEPLLKLVEHHEVAGNQQMVETLRSLERGESCKALMEKLGLPKTHIHYLRLKGHKELNQAYGLRTA